MSFVGMDMMDDGRKLYILKAYIEPSAEVSKKTPNEPIFQQNYTRLVKKYRVILEESF